jgi:hypothetical protein
MEIRHVAVRSLGRLGIVLALIVAPTPSVSAADSCWMADSELNFRIGGAGSVFWQEEGIGLAGKTTIMTVGEIPSVTMCFHVAASKKHTSYVIVDRNVVLALRPRSSSYSSCVEIERNETFDPVEVTISANDGSSQLMHRRRAVGVPDGDEPLLPSQGATRIRIIKTCPPSSLS